MADCTTHKNPLIRKGTNQKERFVPALDHDFVVPDENKIQHWLVYARNLSAHLKYYTSENENDGENWQPFFDADVSAQLALIAVQDVEEYKDRIRSLLNRILSRDLENDAPEVRRQFGLLFSGVFSLAYRMDYFAALLPDSVSLKLTISNLIRTRLAPVLKRFMGYYKAAVDFYTPPLIESMAVPDWNILAFKQIEVQEIFGLLKKELTTKWIYKADTATSFEDYYTNHISVDKTIYNHAPAAVADADVWKVLNHAANHTVFTSVFAEFFAVYARMVKDAQAQLLQTVTTQNTHEPHYALYLTFLHLFTIAQGELNSYTRRHLDFYYKEVLRLQPRKSQPNQVHLILELAATIKEHLIKKDTAFKAGKDSKGKEVLYTSDQNVVINRAQVTELRSFYRASAADKIGSNKQEGMVYASPSPKAASADGAGARLTSPTKDWHPFVNKQVADGKLSAIHMPEAQIGFAIASHYLFLKEGRRRITLTLQGNLLSRLWGTELICSLTTEKSWLEKTVAISAAGTVLTIDLPSGDPPITAFVQKVHLDNFQQVDTPVIKFLLKNIAGKDQYEALKDVTLTGIDIKVTVGELDTYSTDGIKELLVSTDFGSVDPSKPFLPFGQNPKSGAGLVIGNKEIFSKKGAKLTASIAWAELDLSIQDMDFNLTDRFFPTAQWKFLENGVWKDAGFTSILNAAHIGNPKTGELELFWGKNSVMKPDAYLPSDRASVPNASIVDYKEEYLPYSISSGTGFFKLQLNDSFQLDEYFSELQLYLIGVANKTIDPANTPKPVPPYIPKIGSVYLSYEASASIRFSSFQQNSGKFIHIYPFGTDEVDKGNVVKNAVTLLPQFVHQESSENVANLAEFYIGLTEAAPAQRVNLLFQVLEGSTNPLQSKPEQHVFWSYLAGNKWVDFEKNVVNDGTRQLIMSGIISFPIPEEATADHTLLPSGFHWLRASIKELPDQVCRLIDVKAQALQATYSPRNNAEDFLKQPLADGSIAKLHVPDAAVKKVEQPYASFGGRYTEDARSFYTRVSERLRHKNRAITIRDFEQLILEAFPDIHKVKCLNHTRLDLQAKIYNEQAAGHVTVITIPDLRRKNAIDPLRPYTSRSRLEEIKRYIQLRSNCHMQLYVENPVFEEVRLTAIVVLREEAAGNDAFYKELLQQELVQFLTPWAYDVNTDITFGGKITKSELINFIEERSYVDFILNLRLFHNRMDNTPEKEQPEEVLASTARSVLVSAPASGHNIQIAAKPLKREDDDCQ